MRETNFRIVANKVNEMMENHGIEIPSPAFESDFTTITYRITHPITDEVIDTYTCTLRESRKFGIKQRNKLKAYESATEYDSKAFAKELKRQENVKAKYYTARDEMIEMFEQKLGITDKINTARGIMSDYIDFDDIDDVEVFEQEFIDSLK